MCKGQKSPPVLFLRSIHLVFGLFLRQGLLLLAGDYQLGEDGFPVRSKDPVPFPPALGLQAHTAWLLVLTHARQTLLRLSCFPASHPRGF